MPPPHMSTTKVKVIEEETYEDIFSYMDSLDLMLTLLPHDQALKLKYA